MLELRIDSGLSIHELLSYGEVFPGVARGHCHYLGEGVRQSLTLTVDFIQ